MKMMELLTDDEKRAIEALACAPQYDAPIRAEAVAIFRRHIRTPQRQWNDHMRFMSEIDSEYPDYGLRAVYRNSVQIHAKARSRAAAD
jgi:hypothetical protein